MKISRIDIIGQNGNDGIHYEYGEHYMSLYNDYKSCGDNLIDKYQAFTRSTAIYPSAGRGTDKALMYTALGLCGETGEVAEKIKKFYRDRELDREALKAELGDVIYYWCRLADELGLCASSILKANEAKLTDRKNRGVLKGSGDNR